jgi:hypothetical protein
MNPSEYSLFLRTSATTVAGTDLFDTKPRTLLFGNDHNFHDSRHVFLAEDGLIHCVVYGSFQASRTHQAGKVVKKHFTELNCANIDLIPSLDTRLAEADYEFCMALREKGLQVELTGDPLPIGGSAARMPIPTKQEREVVRLVPIESLMLRYRDWHADAVYGLLSGRVRFQGNRNSALAEFYVLDDDVAQVRALLQEPLQSNEAA